MKVIVAPRVESFLRSEKDYLDKHSSAAFRRLSLRLRDARRLISRFPEAGMEKPLPVKGIRRLIVDDYVLDYEIRDSEVHILSMRHGRQRDPALDDEPDVDYEV